MHILAPVPAGGQPRTVPSQSVTIANFNQLMKLSPDVFSVWCGAMLRTPGVRLLLLTGVTGVHVAYPSAARNVRGEVAVRGVHISRLEHGGVMQKPMHLIRAAGCDLGVDTLSYNSHSECHITLANTAAAWMTCCAHAGLVPTAHRKAAHSV